MNEEIFEEESTVKVEDSILNSVKKMLGIEPDYTDFDLDIMIQINAALFTLGQLGVGPSDGYEITGPNETYDDYLGEGNKEKNQIKTYLFCKTKMGFDPPQSSVVLEAFKQLIQEAEWRLNVQVDSSDTFSQNYGEIS